MPKINSAGVPSDASADNGVVTNAVGEQFDLSPRPVDEQVDPDDESNEKVDDQHGASDDTPEPTNEHPPFDLPKRKPAAAKTK